MKGARVGANGRRWGVTIVGAFAGVLAAASVALACAPIMGDIRVCSPTTATCSDSITHEEGNAPEGSTVKVRATGLKPKASGARYTLYMGPLDCHNNTNVLRTPAGEPLDAMRTNKRGELDRDLATTGVQPYKAALPVIGVTGNYEWEICARENTPEPDGSITRHPTKFMIVVL